VICYWVEVEACPWKQIPCANSWTHIIVMDPPPYRHWCRGASCMESSCPRIDFHSPERIDWHSIQHLPDRGAWMSEPSGDAMHVAIRYISTSWPHPCGRYYYRQPYRQPDGGEDDRKFTPCSQNKEQQRLQEDYSLRSTGADIPRLKG